MAMNDISKGVGMTMRNKNKWLKKEYLYFVIFIFIISGYFLIEHLTYNDISLMTANSELVTPPEESKLSLLSETTVDITIETVLIYVDVKGEVNAPGVYELQSGTRIIDAIELAGGVTDLANTDQVNFAMLLSDQMMIYVPSRNEVAENSALNVAIDVSPHQDKVNINRADVTLLKTLPGIGDKKAQDIINYREANGSFETVESLKNVKGIGEKTFEQLVDLITVQ